MRVLVAGNPNTGKSSLFNRLTGGNAKVGNYPGVTVEGLRGRIDGTDIELEDLPGTYSLNGRSREEQIAVDALTTRADAVLVCVDSTNLIRNLYLVLQLQEFGLDVVLALTMWDQATGVLPEPEALGRLLECSVVPCVPRTGHGVEDVADALKHLQERRQGLPRWRWTPDADLEDALQTVTPIAGSRALALWALMSLDDEDELEVDQRLRDAVDRTVLAGPDIDDHVVQARYAWLDQHVGPLIAAAPERGFSARLDRVLIHPVFGFAIFLALMFLLFQGLFSWSDPAIGLVEAAFGALGDGLRPVLGQGLVADFIIEALIGGVGGVVVFLPQILLLFFLLGLMEDSGYMARVAYLMDRIMRGLGLHGRAFVPMLSGFACAIPAIMATRTMERQRDRLLTMLVIPLMTCSARLPVYTLVIAALFDPEQAPWLMLGMYVFSVVVALVCMAVLDRFVVRGQRVPLVLELPPYRLPRLVDVLRRMVRNARHFLEEAGTVILVCTVVLWGLLTFPQAPEGLDATPDEVAAMQLRDSYGGRLGQALEPVMEPLGFDWKISVGLVGAFAAREVFVSTMGVVYSLGEDVDEESVPLRQRLREETREDGGPVWTPLTGLSLMVFMALAAQCMSTLAVLKRETGGYRWPAFVFVYMTGLAWFASFLVFQGGLLLGFQ